MKKIGVVGAGVGGLATAARLARRGHEVEVFEKLPECGGRAHMVEDKGFRFDTGSSFVLFDRGRRGSVWRSRAEVGVRGAAGRG